LVDVSTPQPAATPPVYQPPPPDPALAILTAQTQQQNQAAIQQQVTSDTSKLMATYGVAGMYGRGSPVSLASPAMPAAPSLMQFAGPAGQVPSLGGGAQTFMTR
jgi:hypothetical protein